MKKAKESKKRQLNISEMNEKIKTINKIAIKNLEKNKPILVRVHFYSHFFP
jgi:hypothetical protein